MNGFAKAKRITSCIGYALSASGLLGVVLTLTHSTTMPLAYSSIVYSTGILLVLFSVMLNKRSMKFDDCGFIVGLLMQCISAWMLLVPSWVMLCTSITMAALGVCGFSLGWKIATDLILAFKR